MFDSLHAPADLASARARLRAAAGRLAGAGAVFDLAGSSADRGSGGAPWPEIDPVVAVIVADSVLWRTGPRQLEALASALGPQRSLLFLEPTADLGWRRVAHRVGRPLWRRVAGHDFECDVPAVLRAAGLVVVDLNRFGVGRAGVRSYALGRAVPLSPVSPPEGG